MSNYKLAIFGGKKTRSTPMPFRQAFGKNEQKNLYETIQYYRKKRIDPKYKGKFENQLCRKFSSYMGGGMSVCGLNWNRLYFYSTQFFESSKRF